MNVQQQTSNWDMDSKGKRLLSTYNNALLFLESNNITARYNEFASIVELGTQRYDDNHTLELKEKMRSIRLEMNVQTIDEAVRTIALRHRYHPVKQYLESLTWDGTPRLDNWLTQMAGCDDSDYTRFVSRIALLSAVYRVYEAGCQYDTMIILEGDQGIGKSKIVRALGGDWYKSIPLTDRDKDTIQLMQGAWFIEVPELSVFAKRDIESLKAFISSPSDSARFAYGRNDRVYPRQSVFIGTINPESNGYLMDSTGNRRFMPVRLGNIQSELIELNRNQLFAEAMTLYKRRLPIYASTQQLVAMTTDQQKQREFHDDWQTVISNYLSSNRLDTSDLMTACEVYIKVFNGRVENYDQRISRRIANILRKLGCGEPKHTKVNGVQGKYFDVSRLLGNNSAVTENGAEGWSE